MLIPLDRVFVISTHMISPTDVGFRHGGRIQRPSDYAAAIVPLPERGVIIVFISFLSPFCFGGRLCLRGSGLRHTLGIT
jgi:hypothetical protein